MQAGGLRGLLKSNQFGVAGMAMKIDAPHADRSLQDGFDPAIEAALTDVMHGLGRRLIPELARAHSAVYLIRERYRSDLDKRISLALLDGLFGFSQLLTCLDVLALQLELDNVQSEQTLLRLEKFVADLSHSCGDLGKVSQSDRSLRELLGGGNCRCGGPQC